MAYTATLRKKNVMGNQRVDQFLVTADGASGVVATGLKRIDSIAFAPVSMASAGPKFIANAGASASASDGSVNVAGAANGDVFFLTVYGV